MIVAIGAEKGKRVAHDRIYFGHGAMRKTVGCPHTLELYS